MTRFLAGLLTGALAAYLFLVWVALHSGGTVACPSPEPPTRLRQ